MFDWTEARRELANAFSSWSMREIRTSWFFWRKPSTAEVGLIVFGVGGRRPSAADKESFEEWVLAESRDWLRRL
jgi:hypothetical protein